MALSTAGVNIKDNTRARAWTGGVRLKITKPWRARFLRCGCNFTECTARVQRARFRLQMASGGIEVGVLTVNHSKGFIFLYNRGVTLTDARFVWGSYKVPSRVRAPQ